MSNSGKTASQLANEMDVVESEMTTLEEQSSGATGDTQSRLTNQIKVLRAKHNQLESDWVKANRIEMDVKVREFASRPSVSP